MALVLSLQPYIDQTLMQREIKSQTWGKRDWAVIAVLIAGPLADFITTAIGTTLSGVTEYNPTLRDLDDQALLLRILISHSIIIFIFLVGYLFLWKKFRRHSYNFNLSHLIHHPKNTKSYILPFYTIILMVPSGMLLLAGINNVTVFVFNFGIYSIIENYWLGIMLLIPVNFLISVLIVSFLYPSADNISDDHDTTNQQA